jgi:hypothetical protein
VDSSLRLVLALVLLLLGVETSLPEGASTESAADLWEYVLLLLLRRRRRRKGRMARVRRARMVIEEAVAMPALKPVVWTVGMGRLAAEEVAEAAASAVAEVGEVAELVDEGAGEHLPNSLWQPASQ